MAIGLGFIPFRESSCLLLGSKYRLSGRILLMSGRTGHVITWKGVPDGRESYYSPQVYTWLDGTQLVLFGTGGETHGGSLWVIKLDDLIKGDIDKVKFKPSFRNNGAVLVIVSFIARWPAIILTTGS